MTIMAHSDDRQYIGPPELKDHLIQYTSISNPEHLFVQI